ncbi:phenylacetate--CoA ligase family protein [Anaerosoma tenue]|uniref:phenylacetate--CoA ligase family protein n=1 Tax=Anaerosoma tenue TaxID=2933588 RepID=UPI00226092E6|nr:phenylacetate--CoA ligase [Anaerosoma tenue]MCK8114298.1 phenylacetate--CoA ligase [Anaerosoma tenue]
MFQPEYESMDRARLEAVQLERLNGLLARVYENVPTYRRKFDEAGVAPRVVSLEEFASFPFTVKDDLRAAYPYGMFAVPMRDIVRLHSSSGTTGQVTVVGYTAGDIDIWADLMARTIAAAGGTSDDIVQNAYGYGLFTGGLGVHYGAERLGCATIPISGGNTKRQVQVMKDFGTTILACTPSYALLIAETARDMGIDPVALPLKAGIFGAEPWSENTRVEIERQLGITAIDIYGLSEVLGPGVAAECQCKCGLHVNEDHFIIEIVDTETLQPVPDGDRGEVVFTTLTKQGIPVVRYRTRDISRIVPGRCECGRTFRRLERVTGRSDDMLIIRGVNVFPSQIEQVLLGIPGVAPYYQVVLSRRGSMDHVEVHVEVGPEVSFDEIKTLERLRARVSAEIASALAVNIAVKLVEPKSIQRSEGKAKRVLDLRGEGSE